MFCSSFLSMRFPARHIPTKIDLVYFGKLESFTYCVNIQYKYQFIVKCIFFGLFMCFSVFSHFIICFVLEMTEHLWNAHYKGGNKAETGWELDQNESAKGAMQTSRPGQTRLHSLAIIMQVTQTDAKNRKEVKHIRDPAGQTRK